MKRMTKLILVVIAMLPINSGAGAVTSLGNHRVFHGTTCKNYMAGTAEDFYYQYNGIKNVAASARYIMCPIQMYDYQSDVWNRLNNGTYDGVEISVDTRMPATNPSANAVCVIRSQYPDGTLNSSYVGYFGSLGGRGVFVPSSAVGGVSAMYCYLPAGGTLHEYTLMTATFH